MVDSASSGFAYREHPVWLALQDYCIGPEDASLDFAARLARENGWSRGQVERVIAEYKRFVFLAVTAGHPVTPSDAVDQAWHLHLTYTRDYWERFCPNVLGRPLHHEPTAGGATERQRFFEQYAATLKSYAEVFGKDAPSDLWPSAARRLLDDPRARRVHPREHIIMRRSRLGWLILAFTGAASIVTWAMTQGS
jgi:hypothetical protein